MIMKKIYKFISIIFFVLIINSEVFAAIIYQCNINSDHFYEEDTLSEAERDHMLQDPYCQGTLFKDIVEDDDEQNENNENNNETTTNKNKGIFSFDLGKMILDAVTEWIVGCINGITDFFLNLTANIIFPEKTVKVLDSIYDNLYKISMSLAMSLIVLMALYKGFNIYILWKDGNPEENPIEIITRYLFAVALILCFKEIYDIAGNIVDDIIIQIDNALKVSHSPQKISPGLISTWGLDLGVPMIIIFFIVYLVEIVKAMITILQKGIELFVLRLGFPIACIDAITPQASSFHAYISALIKAFLSVIVMKLLFSISITIFFNDFTVNGLIWSITGLIMVNKGSALINQFIIPQQGGSGILHSSMSQAISGKIQSIFNPLKK